MRELRRSAASTGESERGNARGASREELECVPHAGLCRPGARALARAAAAISTPATRRPGAASIEAAQRRRRRARCIAVDAVMAGSVRRAFIPIAGLHHASRAARRGLLRVQRLRRGDRNAPAPARPEAHRLRRHRCASRRRRVLRVRGRSGPDVRGHARGRPLPLSRHGHAARNRRRRRRSARS